jgi:N-acetylmuramate 1-kinase
LRWEIEHFRQWALDAMDRPLSVDARPVFDSVADKLARRIEALPKGFVHRDYQSRNLMVTRADDERIELAWVDFQDALLGPQVYDLVALLNDSYQQFDRSFVEQRLEEFGKELHMDAVHRDELVRHFDWVTVQRKLKDAGRFVFIDRVKHDSSFLRFVEPTIAKVKASLDRLTDDEDMRGLSKVLEPLFR